MTELEKMQRAKMYIDKMANGINPITDREIEETDMVNNVRISRCLFYVSGILENAIVREEKASRPKKASSVEAFPLKLLQEYKYKEDKSINKILQQLYAPVLGQDIRKISGVSINNWLVNSGYLEERFDKRTNRNSKFPTQKGIQFGLRSEYLFSEKAGTEYVAVIYNKAGQENLIANFEKFLDGELI